MEVLTEEALAEKLNYARPLKPEPEKPVSIWCIPFEYGASAKGTRISISEAKKIAAELRAEIAEAEKRELKRYFDREKERGDRLCKEFSEEQEAKHAALTEVSLLKQRLQRLRRRATGR